MSDDKSKDDEGHDVPAGCFSTQGHEVHQGD